MDNSLQNSTRNILNESNPLNNSYVNSPFSNNTTKPNKKNHMDNFEDIEPHNRIINKGNKDRNKTILTFCFIFIFMLGYVGTISVYLMINYNVIQS
jgi:hypothetical protein